MLTLFLCVFFSEAKAIELYKQLKAKCKSTNHHTFQTVDMGPHSFSDLSAWLKWAQRGDM